MIHFKIGTISPDDFIALSKSVGWGKNRKYDLDKVKEALSMTPFIVVAEENNSVIGCLRVFSDDLLMSFIPDLFVHPDYQNQGVGRKLTEMAKERYGHTQFFFGAQEGNEQFFEKLGFKKGMQSYCGTFQDNPYIKDS